MVLGVKRCGGQQAHCECLQRSMLSPPEPAGELNIIEGSYAPHVIDDDGPGGVEYWDDNRLKGVEDCSGTRLKNQTSSMISDLGDQNRIQESPNDICCLASSNDIRSLTSSDDICDLISPDDKTREWD